MTQLKPDTRVRLCRVNKLFLSYLLRGCVKPAAWTNAPSDLEVLAAYHDLDINRPDEVIMKIWSSTFSEIELGQEIPYIQLEYSTISKPGELGYS